MNESIPHSLRSPHPPLLHPPSHLRPLHVVLATTGSVASVKTPLIIERLLSYDNVRIQIISTKASQHFYQEKEIIQSTRNENKIKTSERYPAYTDEYSVKSLATENAAAYEAESHVDEYDDFYSEKGPRLHFWKDEDEWTSWNSTGDPILHIELRRWADIVLIAPCSANTLAKIHAGLCDDLLVGILPK